MIFGGFNGNEEVEQLKINHVELKRNEFKLYAELPEEILRELNYDMDKVKNHLKDYYIFELKNNMACKENTFNLEFKTQQTYNYPTLNFKNLIRKIFKRVLIYEEKTENVTYGTVLNMTQYYPEIELKDKQHFVTATIINDKSFIKNY